MSKLTYYFKALPAHIKPLADRIRLVLPINPE